QKTAVSGFATFRTCDSWGGKRASFIDPKNCDASVPKNMIYDRTSNLRGVRCDIFDNAINIYGRDPKTGLARRPLDNVGVQYGLVAFNSGSIDAEQFVELNEKIGGFDADGDIVAARTAADPESVRIAYQRGTVLRGGGGVSQVPLIDWR